LSRLLNFLPKFWIDIFILPVYLNPLGEKWAFFKKNSLAFQPLQCLHSFKSCGLWRSHVSLLYHICCVSKLQFGHLFGWMFIPVLFWESSYWKAFPWEAKPQ
jgi:hypothetical protein